jgi:hypothetical protein
MMKYVTVKRVVTMIAFSGIGLSSHVAAQTPATPHSCRGTGGGGGEHLSNRVALAHAMSWGANGLRLDAAMLIRGQPGWDHGSGNREPLPDSMPMLPGDRRPELNGGTVDTLSALYDRANDVAWIGGRRIPMHGANVVLFDRADGVGGPPFVSKLIHVDPHLLNVPSPCKEHMSHEDHMAHMAALKSAIMGNADVQEFIRNR